MRPIVVSKFGYFRLAWGALAYAMGAGSPLRRRRAGGFSSEKGSAGRTGGYSGVDLAREQSASDSRAEHTV